MTSPELENLVAMGVLKREPYRASEFEGLVRSAEARLPDATNTTLSNESRFDLAYNAAHALSLAALRAKGYRSDNRYAVFQVLPQTLGCRRAPGAFWPGVTSGATSRSTKGSRMWISDCSRTCWSLLDLYWTQFARCTHRSEATDRAGRVEPSCAYLAGLGSFHHRCTLASGPRQSVTSP